MQKLVIFNPRKTFKSAVWNIKMAVDDLGLSGAEELGIELIKVDGVYYTVRNLHVSDGLNNNIILETDSATERHSPASIVGSK